ncbi:hypothetical protein MJN51_40870, partial [Salmonella enterica subsp. enterica serovar Kentucky]|nr:hypothetical protein [Salmonella enterica subsp. enterica serovar Kentucky]
SQGPTAAKYILETVKPQRIAIIHDKQQYGEGLARSVQDGLKQTMNMAKATAALITEKIRHACGAQVECVIADTCIAGMAESAA